MPFCIAVWLTDDDYSNAGYYLKKNLPFEERQNPPDSKWKQFAFIPPELQHWGIDEVYQGFGGYNPHNCVYYKFRKLSHVLRKTFILIWQHSASRKVRQK